MKISKIPVEWGWENEEWEIDYLCHAYRVDVYDRNEDAKSGTHVVVEDVLRELINAIATDQGDGIVKVSDKGKLYEGVSDYM